MTNKPTPETTLKPPLTPSSEEPARHVGAAGQSRLQATALDGWTHISVMDLTFFPVAFLLEPLFLDLKKSVFSDLPVSAQGMHLQQRKYNNGSQPWDSQVLTKTPATV